MPVARSDIEGAGSIGASAGCEKGNKMSERINTQTSSPVGSDTLLSRAREAVAALIALLIIVCLIFMLWQAFNQIQRGDKSDIAFQQVKDLLLFINPLVGVVIGYYFNKVSTESRAESAEATAQAASLTAHQAQAARSEAEHRVTAVEAEAVEATDTLHDFVPLTEEMLAQLPALAGAVGEAADPSLTLRYRLQNALQRAKRITG